MPDVAQQERKAMGVPLSRTDLCEGAGWRSDLQRAPEGFSVKFAAKGDLCHSAFGTKMQVKS